jgi:hypothetical protein
MAPGSLRVGHGLAVLTIKTVLTYALQEASGVAQENLGPATESWRRHGA